MPLRSFLRRVGVGAAAAFVLADVAIAYRACDHGVLAEGRGPAFDAWNTWRNGTDAMSMVPYVLGHPHTISSAGGTS